MPKTDATHLLCIDPPQPVQGYVLGFDFGTKRIGVAVGQTLTQTAKPLIILKADKGTPRWSEVKTLIQTWEPVALVVGIPLNMDDTAQKLTDLARHFAYALKKQTHLPVFGVDERLTTQSVRSTIFETQGYRGLKQSSIDAEAAALLLTEWLQHLNQGI